MCGAWHSTHRYRIRGGDTLYARPHDARAEGLDILLLAPQPFFSERGTPIAVRLLAETLGKLGHRVEILTYPMGREITAEGVSISRCRKVPGVREVGIGFSWAKIALDVSLCLRFLSMAKPGRYDVVHAVEESIYPALALRWRHKARVVYDMDSSLAGQLDRAARPLPLGRLFRRLERWAIRRADGVVTMCEDLAQHVRHLRPSQTVHVLHDVPVEPAQPTPAPERLADVVGHGRRVALYVGNLQRYQGIDLLLESLRETAPDTPLGIVIVGGEARRVERYRARAAALGVADRVTFLGRRPMSQLPALLAQADILVSPRCEGTNTPLKIYSYMKAGRAILATRLQTHTQVLDDTTAMLTAPEPAAMARAFERLAADSGLRISLGEAAAERVATRYSRSHFRDTVVDAYDALLRPEGNGRPARQRVEVMAGS